METDLAHFGKPPAENERLHAEVETVRVDTQGGKAPLPGQLVQPGGGQTLQLREKVP